MYRITCVLQNTFSQLTNYNNATNKSQTLNFILTYDRRKKDKITNCSIWMKSGKDNNGVAQNDEKVFMM